MDLQTVDGIHPLDRRFVVANCNPISHTDLPQDGLREDRIQVVRAL